MKKIFLVTVITIAIILSSCVGSSFPRKNIVVITKIHTPMGTIQGLLTIKKNTFSKETQNKTWWWEDDYKKLIEKEREKQDGESDDNKIRDIEPRNDRKVSN